jgi:hypothetical protein
VNKKKLLALLAAIAAAIAALAVAFHGGHHVAPKPVDGDKASDCWAIPDVHGRRHCDTVPAPRFGNQH